MPASEMVIGQRRALIAGLGLSLAAMLLPNGGHAAEGQSAIGMLVDYKDWEIGCDNTRSCVAIGMTSEDGTMSAYLRIVRDGGAEDAPLVNFVIYPPDDSTEKLKQPLLRLSFDAHKAGGLPKGALTLEEAGDLYSYQLAEDALPDLIAGMRSATTITADLYDGDRKLSSQVISLAGSVAALLQMDDAQQRVGTVTALIKKGDAAADTIPPVPALPVVKSLPVSDMADPLPEAPDGLPKPSPDDCGEGPAPYIGYDLGEGAQLWGVCASAGAYNYAYDFHIVRDGAVEPVQFLVPDQTGDDASQLWNSYVDDETGQLNAFFKGRGLGDCGGSDAWAWDGKAFAPTLHMGMGACRGVMMEDWPVLYRAETE